MNKREIVHVHRINMEYMCIAVAGVMWYNICIVCRLINVDILLFLNKIHVIREMPDNWHNVDVIYMHLNVAALPRPVTVIYE